MTAGHLADDVLVALALDDLDSDERVQALEHLRGCGACRAGYDEIRVAVDAALPATAVLEPSPGFDERVLAAMGMSPTAAPSTPVAPVGTAARTETAVPLDARRRRAWRLLPAAAALAVGLALGAGGTWLATQDDDTQVSTVGTPLTTADGDVVGSVSHGSAAGEPVLVVAIADAPDDARYTCVVTLADQSEVDVGTWTLPDGQGTWVLTGVDPAQVTGVEMVRSGGGVWASAELS
jgi:hypothetical protein